MGDFNALLHRDEKRGGRPKVGWMLKEFKHFIDDCSLMDLQFKCFPFTWRNKRDSGKLIMARLDRALCTPQWFQSFPRCMLHHLSVNGSDHIAIMLCLNDSISHSRCEFLFDSRWVKKDEFKPVIEKAWASPSAGLCKVSHTNYADVNMISRPGDEIDGYDRAECCRLEQELSNAWRKEEMFWLQKSRIAWLAHGDKNTKFFTGKHKLGEGRMRLLDWRILGAIGVIPKMTFAK
ncbi:uncharacterized protein LOC132272429 [Cornus florida]|uniref:uncharacterized protein LOC132272429 n=1 Tax=Cornus florida TaxID=4283 RepID=UPI00289932AF|nr:uncharacterized protein LOC132272429 [Cornus florida]